jgi:hypothetical protein
LQLAQAQRRKCIHQPAPCPDSHSAQPVPLGSADGVDAWLLAHRHSLITTVEPNDKGVSRALETPKT